jgi:hypothetical protein
MNAAHTGMKLSDGEFTAPAEDTAHNCRTRGSARSLFFVRTPGRLPSQPVGTSAQFFPAMTFSLTPFTKRGR